MPLFSVVIPTFNRGQYISAALDSVFAQDCQDFEVIVVDDGSTDDTVQRLQPYLDRIKYLRQDNQGPGPARNLALKYCGGEYVAFLDSDDQWFPWTLATYVQIIKKHANPTLIAGKLAYFHDDNELRAMVWQPLDLEVFPDYFAASLRGRFCGTCQMAVRRAAILEIGGFVQAPINAEDHDAVMRLGTAPGFVYVVTPPMIAYRQHAEAATRDFSRTYAGLSHLLQMENTGNYPGSSRRRWDRRRILSQHIRSHSMDLLRHREYQKAWTLYRQTFSWNLFLGRFRYLAGFLVKAATSIMF